MDEAARQREPVTVVIEAPDGLDAQGREALAKVAALLRGLRFGTILLVVHEGEVVQIEAAEKIRLR